MVFNIVDVFCFVTVVLIYLFQNGNLDCCIEEQGCPTMFSLSGKARWLLCTVNRSLPNDGQVSFSGNGEKELLCD